MSRSATDQNQKPPVKTPKSRLGSKVTEASEEFGARLKGFELDSGDGRNHLRHPKTRIVVPFWARTLKFFLSAFLYLSYMAFLAPLPILYVFFMRGRVWAIASVLVNAAIVLGFNGWSDALTYSGFVGVISLALAEGLRARWRPESAISFAAVLTALVLGTYVFYFLGGFAPGGSLASVWEAAHTQISTSWDRVMQSLSQTEWVQGGSELEAAKRTFLVELPSSILIFLIAVVWCNFVALFRGNPGAFREKLGLPKDYLRMWKVAEWMVWPTLVLGALLLVDAGPITDWAYNLFRVVMMLYVLQGLSIIGFLFEKWNINRAPRWALFFFALTVGLPITLSLGFFDLWFDFRRAFRQSRA